MLGEKKGEDEEKEGGKEEEKSVKGIVGHLLGEKKEED